MTLLLFILIFGAAMAGFWGLASLGIVTLLATQIIWMLVGVAVFFMIVIATYKIIRKAGFSGWWIILTFIPVVNLVLLWIFAFTDWPAQRISPFLWPPKGGPDKDTATPPPPPSSPNGPATAPSVHLPPPTAR